MTTSTMKAISVMHNECPHCPGVQHLGGPCPKVRAVEYYPNGMIKRVEFHTDTGYGHPFTHYADHGHAAPDNT